MKKWSVLAALAIALSGCVSVPEAQPPLRDTGEQVAPPPGCEDLRARGGRC